jgi:hypothetical protein
MSISSVSGAQPPYAFGAQNPNQQDFQSLVQAVKSGDLNAAQQAFTAFSQNAPQTQGRSGGPFQQAIQAIGSALQSGDISGAQSALQGLQKGHHGGGHHHHGGGAAPAASSASSPATALLDTSA